MIFKFFSAINNKFKPKKNRRKIIDSSILENEWAHIFHDSIRGKQWLEELPLNIGRWAGNYTFFYILNRILNDYKPKKILEFGLGESSKFITAYLENYLKETDHLIIEQNKDWKELFISKNKISKRTSIEICELKTKTIFGKEVKMYSNLENHVASDYDLYVIDGPLGSNSYSRYDIVPILQKKNKDDQFIIIYDDYQRKGEQQTAQIIIKTLKEKNIKVFKQVYEGSKQVLVIGTEQYQFVRTL